VHARHEALVDAAVPALVGVVIVVGEALHGGQTTGAASVALGLAAAAALWLRRIAPGWALALSGALVAVLFHVDRSAATVAVLAPAVALYSLAVRRGRTVQLLAAVTAIGAVLLADLLHTGRPGILQTLGHVLLVAIPLLAAEAIRTHRANVSLLTDRLQLAGRAQEQEAERRAEQERMRIARELHDVVAHTLTEINVQAAAAAERAEPGQARMALERIEDASHGAIGELRAILGVLRNRDGPDAPRGPTPTLRDIRALVARARDTGLAVELELSGEQPERVSDATSLAAYRIVQESLTNARRHAPGTAVRVALGFNGTDLGLSVENRGTIHRNGGDRGAGAGIPGMRERATAIGGSLQAGPTRDGFAVRATLPYEPGG
jgi:signal transduction histidine kinase